MAAAYDICPYLLCSSHFYRLKEHPQRGKVLILRSPRFFAPLTDLIRRLPSQRSLRISATFKKTPTHPKRGSARPSVSLRYTYFHKTPDYRNTQTNLMAEDRVTPVDDIADDDSKLEEKASKLLGHDVVIDAKETIGKDLEEVERSVCAIFIKKHGAVGGVRVFSNPVTNVVTGPTQGTGFVIVAIKPDEDCRLFGNPSVRYFRCRSS